MSEFINNSVVRKEKLKGLIRDIHNGMPLDKAKELFKLDFDEVSTEEITTMEHELIEEGMPVEEVQGLCDVHSALFNGSISDIHKPKDETKIPGHPLKVFLDENRKIEQVLESEIKPFIGAYDKTATLMIRVGLERLSEVSKHYARKENLFFPGLEKRDITSIPKVMWGVDNQIRDMMKDISQTLSKPLESYEEVHSDLRILITKVEDMIMKEDQILTPLLLEKLSLYDWILADGGSDEIGYFIDAPTESWSKKNQVKEDKIEKIVSNNELQFDAGSLTSVEANAILNSLPLDMTFVDKDDKVKYFTQGKERIFDRPKTIIGRDVSMCHPPQSVHIVEKILDSFKNGEKDEESFWIQMGKMFVHIRYFAVRDANGNYLGTLEFTQDIKPLRDLDGEKRLLSY